MTKPAFDRDYWEQLWSKTLVEHADKIAKKPPNAHLTSELAALPPGRALDAGCGHGAETIWLAAHAWNVTAVDFSPAALAHAGSTADAIGVGDRIVWVDGDLATWSPPPAQFDLVVCLYVHVAGSLEEMVQRMASGVAPGGTLFMVGHRQAGSQVQVTVEAARAALDPKTWELVIAEERLRAVANTGNDAVIRAKRIA